MRPIKQVLGTYASKWMFVYTKYLSDQVLSIYLLIIRIFFISSRVTGNVEVLYLILCLSLFGNLEFSVRIECMECDCTRPFVFLNRFYYAVFRCPQP